MEHHCITVSSNGMVSGLLRFMTAWCRYLDYFWGLDHLYTVAEGDRLQQPQAQQKSAANAFRSEHTLVKPSAWPLCDGWTLHGTRDG